MKQSLPPALRSSLSYAAALLLAVSASADGPALVTDRGERDHDARLPLNREFRALPASAQPHGLRSLARAVPELVVEHEAATGATRSLSSHTDYLTAQGDGEPIALALDYVRLNLVALGLEEADLDHLAADSIASPTGATHVYLRQGHESLAVHDAQIHVVVNREGRILSLRNSFLPGLGQSVNTLRPTIGLRAAVRAAMAFDNVPLLAAPDVRGRLMLLPIRQGAARLVWSFEARSLDGRQRYDVTVDAVDGRLWTRFKTLGEGASAPVWASVARVAEEKLVEQWGFDPDIQEAGGAGNQRMALYVSEAVRSAVRNPTATEARDAIIQAAIDNHGGEDVCLLWEAFAAAGLGTDAVGVEGAGNVPVEGFRVPATCVAAGNAGTPETRGGSIADESLTGPGASSLAVPDAVPDDGTSIGVLATGGPGASLPYVEVQAEDAATNGAIIGPSFTYNTLAGEASGRRAVTLSGQGRFVEFTLPTAANSIVVRYSIPDGPGGAAYTAQLGLYVNGVKQPSLVLTNAYSWFYGSYPFTNAPGSNPHHFYDEVQRLLPQMAAGARVRLQVDPESTGASSYTIDLADFEQVAPPAPQPANSVSVTSFGADPSGVNDSTSAFSQAVAGAAGRIVWIPAGTFRVNGHVIVNNVTVRGAGMWHSIVTGNDIGFYGNFPPTPSTNVHLSDFQIQGNIRERCDSCQVNGIGGALQNSTVTNVWIEHTKVGVWVDGPFDNLTLTRLRIRNQTADAINFHRGVTNSTVTQGHFRNLGDDGLAMWAESTPDANNSFTFNTVELPILANGIAIYGGRDNTVTDNRVIDAGLSQGGGIHVGNRFAATALAGTTTIARNTIVRSGSLDPNWQFGVGSIWFDARDQAMSGTINVSDLLIQQAPYSAIHFISGSSITNVNFSDVTITGTGTFVLQLQVGGSARFTNVVATGVGGPAGIYNCGVAFQVVDGGGNSGWQTTFCGPWPNPNFPPPVGLTTSPTALSFGTQTVGTVSAAQAVTVRNTGSSAAAISSVTATGDFAHTHNCGASLPAGGACTVSVTFRPAAAGNRSGTLTIASNAGNGTVSLSGTATAPGPALTATPTGLSFGSAVVGTTTAAQTVSVQNTGTAAASIASVTVSGDFIQTNTCAGSLAVGASCTVSVSFRPTVSGSRTGSVSIASNAVNAPTTIALSGSGISTTTNVALGRPVTASSTVAGLSAASATDGNADSYWESANNAFPQWIQVDLGSAISIGRIVLKLPPAAAWGTRTQTLSVLGSTDGTTFTTIVGSAGYTFNPATANTVTITFPATSRRHVRLHFTANTGWPAGQLSELEVYPAAGTPTGPALAASPSSLAFGSLAVGSTSAPQAVTIQNVGSGAASITSIAASGDFLQANNCGGSLAAGASCTVSVSFRPTVAGTRTGSVSIASNAPGSPLTVSLSGTGATSTTNLALGRPMSASSFNASFTPNFANDANPGSYWESANNAFPQWLQVDLGAPTDINRIVLKLPPTWGARTQTLSVQGSLTSPTTGFATLVASAGYQFNPASANTVEIRFNSISTRYVRLNFTANTGWPAGQVSELELYGGGGGPATLTANPITLGFGNQVINTTSARTVAITNTGTVSATVSGVTITGAGFSQTHNCAALAAGASCTVTVTFLPTALGTVNGTLTINSNASNPSLAVPVSGTGVAPGSATLSANPTSLAFGNQQINTSSARAVTITNTGTGSGTVSGVTITGANANQLTQTNNCATLAAGASCTVNVTFTPTTVGAKSATLTIASNATNPSLTVAMTGNGTNVTDPPSEWSRTATMTSSGIVGGFPATNANDGTPGNVTTYWESAGLSSPEIPAAWLNARLTQDVQVSQVIVRLNPDPVWATRTQTFAIEGRALSAGATGPYVTLVASAAYTFNPAAAPTGNANTVTVNAPAAAAVADLRLRFTANTGAGGGQVADLQIMGVAGPNPDLTITGVSATPANPTETTQITVNATVSNIGTLATPTGTPVTVRFFCGTTQVGSTVNLSALAAGASTPVTASIGPQPAGTCALSGRVDDPSTIVERNEGNNTASGGNVVVAPVQSADLVANTAWSPATPSGGQTVTFSTTITNQGNQPSSATPHTVTVTIRNQANAVVATLSPANQPSGIITAGGSVTVLAGTWLAVNGRYTVTTTVAPDQAAEVPVKQANNTTVASLTVGRGANMPYDMYEAEDGTLGGGAVIVGPNRTIGDIAGEASGRRTVRLPGNGAFVQWTTRASTNTVVARFSIPDNTTATLGVFNGATQVGTLNLTAKYAWLYGAETAPQNSGTGPRHIYDEANVRLSATVPAGVPLQLRNTSTQPIALDFMQLEQVTAVANPNPTGLITVNGFDQTAVQNAINTANQSATAAGIFMPAGDYQMNTKIQITQKALQIVGAGPWFTRLFAPQGSENTDIGFTIQGATANGSQLRNFALFGNYTSRLDGSGQMVQLFNVANVTMDNVWIEHSVPAIWTANIDNSTFTNLRLRNLFADGINLNNDSRNNTIRNCESRASGDDSFAMFNAQDRAAGTNTGNTFENLTSLVTWRANGVAVYGGSGNTVRNIYVADTLTFPGLTVSSINFDIPFVGFSGTTTFDNISIVRGGGHFFGNQVFPALWLMSGDGTFTGIRISNVDIDDPTYIGVMFQTKYLAGPTPTNPIEDTVLANVTVNRANEPRADGSNVDATFTFPLSGRAGNAAYCNPLPEPGQGPARGAVTLTNLVMTNNTRDLVNPCTTFTITRN